MTNAQQKVLQYLNEAYSMERGLARVLQSQIAMTPRGSYRTGLEQHLAETRDHAERLTARLRQLDQGANPLMAVVGFAQSGIGQALALAKTPLDLLRGSGGEEKVLKNAKDACATEALEIATYTALEQLARAVDDRQTARLATEIRADEERMLERVLGELPKLSEAVVGADVRGNGSYDLTRTGAADGARRTARQTRKVPGVAQAEGQAKGAVASEQDLAIPRYDKLTAEEIVAKLSELSQIDLAKVDAYERKNQNRSTVRTRIASLRGDEPWPGYDELTAAEVRAVVSEGDEDLARLVQSYERAHKDRAGVLQAVERELASA